jgi:hypothetical protein
MASPIILPWDPSYHSGSNPVPSDVVVPWNGPVTPAPIPVPATPSVAPVVVAAWEKVLEKYVVAAAERAALSALPSVESLIEGLVTKEVGKVISPPPEPPNLDLDVLTHAAARDRAVRSLLYGVLMSGLWGAIGAVSSLSGVDWFTKNGLVSALSILGAGVVGSVMSYVGRIKWAPPTPTTIRARLGLPLD